MQLMKTPRSIDLAITNNCNLRCEYCSHFMSPGDVDEDLSKEEWLCFFDELKRCSVLNVVLEGGEPFYRKDLADLIEGIVKNRMRFDVLSNGTLITDETASFISTTGRCNYVQVSIDGSEQTVHDSFRGKGSFEKALRGMDALLRNHVPLTVRVTIHKQNLYDLDEIAKMLLEEIGLKEFSTNAASHLGLCRKNTDRVQLTAEERSYAMEKLLELNRKYSNRISAAAGPLAEAHIWRAMVNARREKNKPGNHSGFLKGCGAPMTKLAVRADGVIVPCSQLSHIELGRINKDDLAEVWQDHPELSKMRNRVDIPLSNFEFCQGCEYIDYCTGNCPAMSYTLTGNEYHPSPDACLRKFLDEGGRLPETDSISDSLE